MSSLQERKQEFQERFTEDALDTPGVTDVKFFGSFEEPRFKPGRSDIDIWIGGHVSKDNQRKLTEDVIKLNDLLDLGLETACYEHPTPVFEGKVYSESFRKVAYDEELDSKTLSQLGNIYRKAAKKVCIPHELIWKIQGLI